jgi:cobalamin transport system ATP-binding protein
VSANEGLVAGLVARAVSASLGHVEILKGVDLDVQPGEWFGVVGPNGAGKTTLLRALAGLQQYSGSVSWAGSELDRLTPRHRARLVSLVAQNPVIPAAMSVYDYVLLGRTPHLGRRLTITPDDERIATQVLGRLDLDRFAARPIAGLSGGERQRVVIGRALAQQAAVLLLDEPTSSLDLGHQQDVLELIDELRAERALTVVMTMHDLTLAAQFADRLALLEVGAVTAVGEASEVLKPERLAAAYGADVLVIEGPSGPVIVPKRRR